MAVVTRLGARPFALAALVLTSITSVAAFGDTRAAAASTTSRFETGAPCRLADVRDGTGFERVD